MVENTEVSNTEDSVRIYFPELDGLRFFAFLLVFIHHQNLLSNIPGISILRSNGWIGVDLFFVLSAYLFTKLLIAEYIKTSSISFKKFYLRRIFRIWPIYFLFVGFSMFVFFILQKGMYTDNINLRLIGLLTFTDNLMTAITGVYNSLPYIGHLWTIGYEEQFYIFIPIIILIMVRSSYRMKIITFLLVVIIFNFIRFLLIYNNSPHLAIWALPFTHFESIVLGIVIGFYGPGSMLNKINPTITGLLGILFFAFICLLPGLETTSYWLIVSYSFIGISTSLVLYSVLQSNRLRKFFSRKIFVFLGKRSYGLYVYHLLGLSAADIALKHFYIKLPNSLLIFLYSLFFTILVSIISYKYIEKPFLKLKRRFEIIVSRPI